MPPPIPPPPAASPPAFTAAATSGSKTAVAGSSSSSSSSAAPASAAKAAAPVFGPDPGRRARITPHAFKLNMCRNTGLPPSSLAPAALEASGLDLDTLRQTRVAALRPQQHPGQPAATAAAAATASAAVTASGGSAAEAAAAAAAVVAGPVVAVDPAAPVPVRWSVQKVSSDAPATVVMTRQLLPLYKKVNPQFDYHRSANPRRVLTEPSARVGNNGHDNVNSNLIMCVGDILHSDSGRFKAYRVMETLGQGTFGQVRRHAMQSRRLL